MSKEKILKSIVFTSVKNKNGTESTGYRLVTDGPDGSEKETFLRDFIINNTPGLREDIVKLMSTPLPAKVDVSLKRNEQGFGWDTTSIKVVGVSSSDTETTAPTTPGGSKKPYTPARVFSKKEDDSTQKSIQRQNALTNATNVFCALVTSNSSSINKDTDVSSVIINLARELLKIHD